LLFHFGTHFNGIQIACVNLPAAIGGPAFGIGTRIFPSLCRLPAAEKVA
jgi:hypothetical protein